MELKYPLNFTVWKGSEAIVLSCLFLCKIEIRTNIRGDSNYGEEKNKICMLGLWL